MKAICIKEYPDNSPLAAPYLRAGVLKIYTVEHIDDSFASVRFECTMRPGTMSSTMNRERFNQFFKVIE